MQFPLCCTPCHACDRGSSDTFVALLVPNTDARATPILSESLIEQSDQAEDGAETGVGGAEASQGGEFGVTIEKMDADEGLGVLVRLSTRFPCLQVQEVQRGLVLNWNERYPAQAVRALDLLVEVNGVRGPTNVDVMERLKTDMKLQLVFKRRMRDP